MAKKKYVTVERRISDDDAAIALDEMTAGEDKKGWESMCQHSPETAARIRDGVQRGISADMLVDHWDARGYWPNTLHWYQQCVRHLQRELAEKGELT